MAEEAGTAVETVYAPQQDGGDHVIVVGRVLDLGVISDGGPLIFFQGGYGQLKV